MKLSTVNSTAHLSRDESPTNEIESGQSLQSFLSSSEITSFSKGGFDKVSGVPPSPATRQIERSQPPQANQLDLLALLEKSLEPALRIELVPVNVAVGIGQRFWLIHQQSGLQVPGQLSQTEAEYILKTTEHWDWGIEYRPRTPNCNKRLLSLLTAVCTPQKVLERAA
jgi:hypothetical protein